MWGYSFLKQWLYDIWIFVVFGWNGLLRREDGHSKWDQSFKHSSFFSQLSEWNYKTLASMDSQVLSSDWKKENANTSSYKVRGSVTVESWYFSTLKGPNLGGWGILFRCLLGISWLRCFKHVHKGRGPVEDSGYSAEMISFGSLGKCLMSPWMR